MLGGELAAVPVGRRALRARARAARSSPTSRASARPSRRSPRSRPTTPTPAIVVCPASLKLNWEREAAHWLPHRAVAVVEGRVAVPPTRRHHDPQLRDRRRAPRGARPRPRRGRSSSTSRTTCKNPQAKRTQAVRRLAEAVAPDGLRLALTGTPVLNHAEELITQLRVLGRLEDFGSGARFARQFRGELTRGAPALAPAPPLLRAAPEDRGAAPAAGQAPGRRAGRARQRARVPARRGRRDRLAARAAAGPLRAQREDRRDAARRAPGPARRRCSGSPRAASSHAALAWIDDFLASGEPLVVFARHVEVQEAVLERFPDAAHLLGRDSLRRARGGGAGLPGPRRPAAASSAPRASRRRASRSRARRTSRSSSSSGRRRCTTRPRTAATASASATRSPPGTCSPPTRSTRRWPRLIERKRGLVAAVTDGRRLDGDGLVEGVVRELRDGKPFRHLRKVI